MASRVIWHGRTYNRKLFRHADGIIKKMSEGLRDFIKSRIGTPGYPGGLTGALKNSIAISKIKLMAYRVGSNLDYALFLELGTSKTPAKPFLKRSLNLYKRAMARMIK